MDLDAHRALSYPGFWRRSGSNRLQNSVTNRFERYLDNRSSVRWFFWNLNRRAWCLFHLSTWLSCNSNYKYYEKS